MKRGSDLVKISKTLSWALRHGISELRLSITPAGYVKVSDLLSHPKFKSISLSQIETIVQTCEKQRFDLREIDGELMIRANQGHTIKQVNEEDLLTPIQDPSEYPIVLHGTNKASWKLIKHRGLYKMQRNHIHFAVELPGNKQVISGARVNCEVFIYLDIAKCMNDGMRFFVSQNRVVLTSGFNGFVSPAYFSIVLVDRKDINFEYKPLEIDYFLVLDFEANCDKTDMICNEIIEFPVIALNARTLNADFTFHQYVRPEVVPDLSEFCTELTGITQEMVSGQKILAEVLQDFDEFLERSGIKGSKWVFLTCGDWDLKTCLPKEAEHKKIVVKDWFKSWINIKFLAPKFSGGMMELLKLLEIEHRGRHHSGIDDVRNIVECLKVLIQTRVQISIEDVRGDLWMLRNRL